MKLRIKALIVAAVVSGAGMAVAPSVGRAQVPPPTPTVIIPPAPSDALVFVGRASIASGGGAGLTAPCGVAVCLVGGTGTFNAVSDAAACYSGNENPITEEAGGAPAEVAVTVGTATEGVNNGGNPCTFTVTGGAFTNVVCGTGTAGGTANLSGEPEGVGAASFNIGFIATVGLVSGFNAEGEPFYGVVVITADPTSPTPDVAGGQCATGFRFVGGVVAYNNLLTAG